MSCRSVFIFKKDITLMHASLETITKVSIWKFRFSFVFYCIFLFFILIRKCEGNLDRLITTLSPSSKECGGKIRQNNKKEKVELDRVSSCAQRND